MSELDETKEKLTEFRFWRSIIVALLIGILGWLLTNNTNSNTYLFICAILASVVLFIFLIILTIKIIKKIKQIKDL